MLTSCSTHNVPRCKGHTVTALSIEINASPCFYGAVRVRPPYASVYIKHYCTSQHTHSLTSYIFMLNTYRNIKCCTFAVFMPSIQKYIQRLILAISILNIYKSSQKLTVAAFRQITYKYSHNFTLCIIMLNANKNSESLTPDMLIFRSSDSCNRCK